MTTSLYSSKVLIIDTYKSDRDSLRRELCHLGPVMRFDIQEATTGTEAIELLANNHFDYIILDYNLDDINGISLLRSMVDQETNLPPAAVIMLTRQGNEAVMGDALGYGAQDYLVKENISTDILQIALQRAKENYELKKEHFNHSKLKEELAALRTLARHVNDALEFNSFLTAVLRKADDIVQNLDVGQPSSKRLTKANTSNVHLLHPCLAFGALGMDVDCKSVASLIGDIQKPHN